MNVRSVDGDGRAVGGRRTRSRAGSHWGERVRDQDVRRWMIESLCLSSGVGSIGGTGESFVNGSSKARLPCRVLLIDSASAQGRLFITYLNALPDLVHG